ncbi:MAG: DUF4440 domain-containing protein [Gemmatimonadaceae bacterium]|nr:DUF4440 domain-containing protein [Gemmatimonadaceae bacterium]NUQ91857.1 DUF4440 domain-containing protein [Gemmatimonadaceae bacterium]NUR20492.1 DUF4440 domain-containing protein [Gemmatimonadaceae bacterium]NUS99003.1 DUF4440 domain-containing protein [Gemmatimonadaceae bacterium]
MRTSTKTSLLLLTLALAACDGTRTGVAAAASAKIDSLNARTAHAYRSADPRAYGALYADSAVFEWPAFNSARGPAGLEAMARDNWRTLRDMDLRLHVAERRIAPDHATEFGAFEQDYTDSAGKRFTEYGRYVTLLVPGEDGDWRIQRFFGFEDSTRARR